MKNTPATVYFHLVNTWYLPKCVVFRVLLHNKMILLMDFIIVKHYLKWPSIWKNNNILYQHYIQNKYLIIKLYFFSSFAKAKGCALKWTWNDVPHPRQEDGHSCGVHVLMVFFFFEFSKICRCTFIFMHSDKVFKIHIKIYIYLVCSGPAWGKRFRGRICLSGYTPAKGTVLQHSVLLFRCSLS